MSQTIFVVLLVLVDQVSKIWAGSLGWETRLNTGGAFGILGGKSWLQTITYWLLIAVLAIGLFRRKSIKSVSFRNGFLLLLSGGIGNTLDRILYGGVRDFIHLPFWPSFNVADVYITMGIVLILSEKIIWRTRYFI